jgi:hypothetical protein
MTALYDAKFAPNVIHFSTTSENKVINIKVQAQKCTNV